MPGSQLDTSRAATRNDGRSSSEKVLENRKAFLHDVPHSLCILTHIEVCGDDIKYVQKFVLMISHKPLFL